MSQYNKFFPGDKVVSSVDRSKVGWIHATVGNHSDAYVVFFPDTKEQDSYIMHADSLTVYHAAPGKQDGPEIQPRRKKKEDD